jgi:hypothetical protein
MIRIGYLVLLVFVFLLIFTGITETPKKELETLKTLSLVKAKNETKASLLLRLYQDMKLVRTYCKERICRSGFVSIDNFDTVYARKLLLESWFVFFHCDKDEYIKKYDHFNVDFDSKGKTIWSHGW